MNGEYVRRVVGEKVYEKAFHVTYMEEFSQRYRPRENTKDVFGAVLEVVKKKNSLNHNSWFTLTDYELGVDTREMEA